MLTVISDLNKTGKSQYLRSLKDDGYVPFWQEFKHHKVMRTIQKVINHGPTFEGMNSYVQRWTNWQTINNTKLILDDADKKMHPQYHIGFALMLVALSKKLDIVMVTYSSWMIQAIELYSALLQADVSYHMMYGSKPFEVEPFLIYRSFAEPLQILDEQEYQLYKDEIQRMKEQYEREQLG